MFLRYLWKPKVYVDACGLLLKRFYMQVQYFCIKISIYYNIFLFVLRTFIFILVYNTLLCYDRVIIKSFLITLSDLFSRMREYQY
jgi:hypothetical protein